MSYLECPFYPRFRGMQFGFCHMSASAEFAVSETMSVVPTVNLCSKSVSGEVRKYIPSSSNENGYISARVSTRSNLGLAIGISNFRQDFTISPCFGASYNWQTNNISPFISLGLNF